MATFQIAVKGTTLHLINTETNSKLGPFRRVPCDCSKCASVKTLQINGKSVVEEVLEEVLYISERMVRQTRGALAPVLNVGDRLVNGDGAWKVVREPSWLGPHVVEER